MKNPKTATKEETSLISKRLYALIKEVGISEVARRMGVPPSKFQYLGNGGGFTVDMIIDLSNTVGIDWNSVIYDDPEKKLMSVPENIRNEENELEELRKQLKQAEAKTQNLEGQISLLKEMLGMPIIRREEQQELASTGTDSFIEVDEEARRETKVIGVDVKNGVWNWEGMDDMEDQANRKRIGYDYGKSASSAKEAI